MATSLAEIRAKLQAQENRGTKQTSTGDNAIYAHWNIPEGSTARIRFLPDGNAKNSFFWVERAMINLPFAGVKGQSDSKPVTVQVPCVEMFGDSCPILAEVRTWFKDPSLEDLGRKYWKKRSYLFQGFVRENPMSDDQTPENPIRRLIISPQIFNIIKAALMDPEMEELPTDYQGGLDFQVIKTSKGGYADYSTSKWARKESALTAVEQAAIDQYGLFELAEFLPKKPTDVELRVMKEMFEASVNGEAFDMERWGQYFKPRGSYGNPAAAVEVSDDEVAAAPVKATPVAAKPAEKTEEPEAASAPVETPKASSQRAEDILAMIRNRQKV